ncbi:MAG: ADOP family duplicated permease [Bryobacteraceae bacterium]
MTWWSRFWRRNKLEQDLGRELQFHIAERISALKNTGLSDDEARRRVRQEFGGIEQVKEECRNARGTLWFESTIQDLRYALRTLRKGPVFTAVAVLTLGLGIGANTAIFSLLNAIAFRDLPVPHPEQLVRVGIHSPDDPFTALSLPMFEEFARGQRVFSAMFAWWGDAVLNVETEGGLSRADIWAVTGNFYSELGAVPEIGRLLVSADVNLRAAPAQLAVLGYGFWQRHYGGAKNVIGKTIKIEGVPFTIIGVARRGFTGMSAEEEPEVTVPLTAEPLFFGGPGDVQKRLSRRESLWLDAAGRLKSGFTLEQARAQLESLWPSIHKEMAPTDGTSAQAANFMALQIKVEPGSRGASFVRGQFSKPLYVLFAISGLVLLLACVNIASLMLAQVASRSHEIGVRAALGASRTRLVRQMLTESMTLSAAGTLGGFAFAYWGSRALSGFILDQIFIVPAALNVSPDWRILGFTGAAATLTTVLCGWAPCWRATREDPNVAVQQGSRTIARGTGGLGQGLIVTQVALSLILLAGAGLFIRSLEELRTVNPGFRTHGVLQIGLTPKPGRYKDLAWVSYYRQLNERISSLPGVASAALTHNGPTESYEWTEKVRIHGTITEGVRSDLAMVMPGTFRTIGIGLLRGRGFTWQDDDHAPRIAVVSDSFAAQVFPRGNAIGQRLDITTQPKWQNLQIVGIVSNASLYDIRKHQPPTVYLPTTQYGDYMGYPTVLVMTNISPAAMIGPLRRRVESLGREYISRIKTVEQEIDRSLLQERVMAMLSAFFGGLALLLAAIGLYGLMAYNVTRRSREIGIRMALGAQRARVQRMILRETLALALIGVAFGVPCAIAASRLITSLLYGVSASDPLTFVVVSVMLIAIAAIAGFIPAWRAMRLDPITVLRNE